MERLACASLAIAVLALAGCGVEAADACYSEKVLALAPAELAVRDEFIVSLAMLPDSEEEARDLARALGDRYGAEVDPGYYGGSGGRTFLARMSIASARLMVLDPVVCSISQNTRISL